MFIIENRRSVLTHQEDEVFEGRLFRRPVTGVYRVPLTFPTVSLEISRFLY